MLSAEWIQRGRGRGRGWRWEEHIPFLFFSADNGKKSKWVKSQIGVSPLQAPVHYLPLTLSCQIQHQPVNFSDLPQSVPCYPTMFHVYKDRWLQLFQPDELNLHLAFIKMRVRIIETKWKNQTAGGYKKFKWQFSFYLTILIKKIYINLKHINLKCKGHD